MKIAVHCARHPELPEHPLILWEPTQDKDNRGRRRLHYVDILRKYSAQWSPKEARDKNQHTR